MRACDYSVYQITYSTTYAERRSVWDGMDSELTGKDIIEERQYLCVAPDEALARAVYKRYHSNDEFISLRCIGRLNGMVYLQ